LPETYKPGSADKYEVIYLTDGEWAMDLFSYIYKFAKNENYVPPVALRGCLKRTPSFFKMMFISFAPPREMNQRKGVRKRQPHPVCPPATRGHKGATKQGAVRTFSGLPSHILKA